MNNLYMSDKWELYIEKTFYLDNKECTKIIKENRYKVNKDWYFEEIKD